MLFNRKIILLMSLAAFFAATAQESEIPVALKPPQRETLALRAHGDGDQIYACEGSQWMLRGPDARLTDDAGGTVGSHFFGPSWKWMDGSKITATPVAQATPDPQSIPWLLLRVTAHEGEGALKNITSVQRIRTQGGKAPSEPCAAAREKATVRSHYRADYLFYAVRQ